MSGANTDNKIDNLLEEMKSEHDQLFQTVANIREALSRADIKTAKRNLLQLQIFQQAHFNHELELMKNYDYPDTSNHKKKHDTLIETLHSVNHLINVERVHQLSSELEIYLENSLKHIIEVDRPFQEFLSAFKVQDS